jgi:hypothetical protein
VENVPVHSASLRPLPGSRDRASIPILVVRLGPARDFLIALAILAFVLGVAAAIAYVMYG